jgi:hypothetical protein
MTEVLIPAVDDTERDFATQAFGVPAFTAAKRRCDGPGAGLRMDAALAAGAPHRIHGTHGDNRERQRWPNSGVERRRSRLRQLSPPQQILNAEPVSQTGLGELQRGAGMEPLLRQD